MKRMTFSWTTRLALAALLTVGAHALYAQAPGAIGGSKGPAMRPLAPPISGPSKESVLTPDQQKALREATQKHEAEFRKMQEQMSKLQTEMNKLVAAPKFDEKAVREKAQAFSSIQAEHMVLRAKLFAEAVGPTLTQAQREQLEKLDAMPTRPAPRPDPVPGAKR